MREMVTAMILSDYVNALQVVTSRLQILHTVLSRATQKTAYIKRIVTRMSLGPKG
jgi:hypothetical protein